MAGNKSKFTQSDNAHKRIGIKTGQIAYQQVHNTNTRSKIAHDFFQRSCLKCHLWWIVRKPRVCLATKTDAHLFPSLLCKKPAKLFCCIERKDLRKGVISFISFCFCVRLGSVLSAWTVKKNQNFGRSSENRTSIRLKFAAFAVFCFAYIPFVLFPSRRRASTTV